MKLKDIFFPNTIAVKVDIAGKKEIIEYLLELATHSGRVIDKDKVLQDLLEREKVLSTGIGKGVGLPHCKTSGISDFVVSFLTTKNPVDFDTLDGEPASIFFMILGMENQIGLNLKILSKISNIVQSEQNRQSLLNFNTSQEVYDFLINLDENIK